MSNTLLSTQMKQSSSAGATESAAAIESSGFGQQELMTTLAGVTIREYDRLLGGYKIEMDDLNQKKSALREEREAVQKLEHAGEAAVENLEVNEKNEPIGEKVDGTILPAKIISPKDGTEVDTGVFLAAYGIEKDQYRKLSDDRIFVAEGVWDSIKSKIDNRLNAVNSTSETKTIYLQALMDSRRQAMMMLSNLINAENSTKMAIIQNMKG